METPSGNKGFTLIELVVGVVWLSVSVAIVCVVVHFIAKFW
jgi:Tfp pilus assembly protein PilE